MNAVELGEFAISYLISAYKSAFAFFEHLLGSVGLYEFVVASILFTIAFGMIIMPFRGRTGISPLYFGVSDMAARRREAESERARHARQVERESYEYYERNRSRNEAYSRRYNRERGRR